MKNVKVRVKVKSKTRNASEESYRGLRKTKNKDLTPRVEGERIGKYRYIG